MVPSQSSSTPSQVSIASGLMVSSASLQSPLLSTYPFGAWQSLIGLPLASPKASPSPSG